jgi:hypothetical protein
VRWNTSSERSEPTGLFLAEKYLPATMALDLDAVVDYERAAARVASIRHVRITYAPSDETCFSLFEAPSLETIQQANDRFQLGYRRVTEVLEIQSAAGTEPTASALPGLSARAASNDIAGPRNTGRPGRPPDRP